MIIEKENIKINKNKHICISEFVIPDNGIIGISGNSGTGKSTLLNHIHHGQLSHYFGNDIGYMTQENLFFDFMSIKENMELQLSLVNKKLNINDQILLDFHVDSLFKKKVRQLSVGEKQRVDFVTQILKDNKVILFDEPTASLNEHYIQLMKKYLLNLKDRSLIILTSHNPEMFEICDSIYKIENNQLNILKQESNAHYAKEMRDISFHYMRFSLIKFGNKLMKGIPIYLVISLICTGLTLMHSIKYQMLDYQKERLNSLNENEILLMNSEDPYGEIRYSNCLPIDEKDWQSLNKIEGIECYPLYYISNKDSDDNVYTAHIYQSEKEILTFDGSVAIVPYFNTGWLDKNLLYGQKKDDGIYLSGRIFDSYEDKLSDIDYSNLKLDIDVMIPTHYSYNEATYDSFEDENPYIWQSAFLMGDMIQFNEKIDGIINKDYYRSSGTLVDIYVPYQLFSEMVEEHLTHESKEYYGTMMKPYRFGAAYIEVDELLDIEEVNKKIQSVSKLFQTEYSYSSQKKKLEVYQNFKNEIDLFEYVSIIFSGLFAYGYWKMKMKNDNDIHHKLKMLKITRKQYLKYYLIDCLLDTFMVLGLTLLISFLSFKIILSLGEMLVYDANATIGALVFSFIISFIMKLAVERKILYDRD